MERDFTNAVINSYVQWYELVKSLIQDAANAYATEVLKTAKFPSPDGKPSLSMYAIPFAKLRLPEEVRTLMSEIVTTNEIVDRCKKNIDSRGDKTLGAMRQIHQNEHGYLERLFSSGKPPKFDGKSGRYNNYVAEHKPSTNDRGGGRNTTGYVEYSAELPGWEMALVIPRIVFDYINNKLYYSPLHYKSWNPEMTDNTREVDISEIRANPSKYPNPFFLITDISA